MRIHKGDQVIVLSGKDKGKKAEVVRAIPSRERVILEGVNVAKRHAKPTRATQQGGVIDKFMPVHVSTVALICKSCDKPTRAGYRFEDDGEKVRVCRKCGTGSRASWASATSWRCRGWRRSSSTWAWVGPPNRPRSLRGPSATS